MALAGTDRGSIPLGEHSTDETRYDTGGKMARLTPEGKAKKVSIARRELETAQASVARHTELLAKAQAAVEAATEEVAFWEAAPVKAEAVLAPEPGCAPEHEAAMAEAMAKQAEADVKAEAAEFEIIKQAEPDVKAEAPTVVDPEVEPAKVSRARRGKVV